MVVLLKSNRVVQRDLNFLSLLAFFPGLPSLPSTAESVFARFLTSHDNESQSFAADANTDLSHGMENRAIPPKNQQN